MRHINPVPSRNYTLVLTIAFGGSSTHVFLLRIDYSMYDREYFAAVDNLGVFCLRPEYPKGLWHTLQFSRFERRSSVLRSHQIPLRNKLTIRPFWGNRNKDVERDIS